MATFNPTANGNNEFKLVGADAALLEAVSMEIDPDPNPIDGIGAPEAGGSIPFQFPPYVTSDAKSVNWEIKNNKLFEPIVLWGGAMPRKLVLTATYIVTGGDWPASKIGDLTHKIKSYFYRDLAQAAAKIPIIKLKLYNHSRTVSTWRAESVNFAHSGALINDSTNGAQDAQLVFPLRTDVTWDLALVTAIAENKNGGAQIGGGGLPAKPLREWY